MAKSLSKIQARNLRKAGESIKVIAQKLNVSPGSVSIWCSDIRLSPEQIAQLEKRMYDPTYGRRAEYLDKIKKETEARIMSLKEAGKALVGTIDTRDRFIAGVALYWAEGFKKDKQVGFANTDPRMVRVFINWLTEVCDVHRSNIRLRVTLNESYVHMIDPIQIYWSEMLDFPLSSFQKPIIQKVQWKKVYVNPEEYHGVLRVRVNNSLSLLRRILGCIDALSEGSKKSPPIL